MSLLTSLAIIKNYRKDPLAFFQNEFIKNGHRSELNILGKKMLILTHPDDVIHILKDNYQSYSKGRTTKVLKEILGNGLITNEGESWRRQHRLIRPIMSPRVVQGFGLKINSTVQDMLAVIKTDVPVDSFQLMNKMTWRIVLSTLFSQKATPELDNWLDDILFFMKLVTDRTRSAIRLPFWVPVPRHIKVKSISRKFGNYVDELTNSRRKMEEGKKPRDLLQLLLEAEDEERPGVKMDPALVKDEIITFLMAGHETITNTLSWTLILLAQNPSYIKKLQEEADQFALSNDYQQLTSAPWTSAVIDESMRLWPSVWALMRKALVNDKIGDFIIPKNTDVVFSPFLSHRAPNFWERPLDFYPERFMGKTKLQQGIFYPYGFGPRACIGSHFAGLEAKIILANFIHKFEWSIEKSEPQKYEANITLRPMNNTVMIFKERK
jgi:cytochrome P450